MNSSIFGLISDKISRINEDMLTETNKVIDSQAVRYECQTFLLTTFQRTQNYDPFQSINRFFFSFRS